MNKFLLAIFCFACCNSYAGLEFDKIMKHIKQPKGAKVTMRDLQKWHQQQLAVEQLASKYFKGQLYKKNSPEAIIIKYGYFKERTKQID